MSKTALIAYVPALHEGYLKLFKKYPDTVYILGESFIHEHPRMDRDIRAIDPEQTKAMISALGIFNDVQVLNSVDDLVSLAGVQVVMPDEDISHAFHKNHLEGSEVKFEPTFLRWDRQISIVEHEVPPNRVISSVELDRELMDRADLQASKSFDWWRQVGAVLAKNGKILFSGHNKPLQSEPYIANTFGDPRSNFDYGEYIELGKTIHGEAAIIAEAAKKGKKIEGASIYVSTFPCPVCAKLICAAGINKVYYRRGYSMLDAEDLFRAHNIEIVLVK